MKTTWPKEHTEKKVKHELIGILCIKKAVEVWGFQGVGLQRGPDGKETGRNILGDGTVL